MGAGRILGAGSRWAGALLVTVTVLRTHLAHCMEPPGRFLHQFKAECLFTNGTERVRFLYRHIYDRRQIAHFDSELGVFEADTELGRPDAELWNSQPETLQYYRAAADTFCRNNYGAYGPFTIDRRELLQNGDWTFQMLVMLEMSPGRGDIYTCQVEHISLQDPIAVHWEAQSDSARSKMLTGVGGFVLGLIFLAPGLLIYLKNKKGRPVPQPAGLLS
ncbi:DLA class II histocompatibility antigen, DR-1 beta chain-like isoform X12 [Gopherus evgoodei]|uniref:DLA class II histocompatibility antigen, DR-1 beta chain-like isoform X12 n=1 Tax=Gopherus evgoodei TaxID=1825980 RepID=UPI0011D00E00|nr:DLA class II histocompatibility antigen, DR-1 beta chain-like isoform X12 [Gopherus evgoodei]